MGNAFSLRDYCSNINSDKHLQILIYSHCTFFGKCTDLSKLYFVPGLTFRPSRFDNREEAIGLVVREKGLIEFQ
jgi:hypothetical protein